MSALQDEVRAVMLAVVQAEREHTREIVRAELKASNTDRRYSGWKAIAEAMGKSSADSARQLFNRDQKTGASGFAAIVSFPGKQPTVKKSDLDAWIERNK